jgi:hypothetical protein
MWDVSTVLDSEFKGDRSGVLQYLSSTFASDRFFINKCSGWTKQYSVLASRWMPNVEIRKVGDTVIYGKGILFKIEMDLDTTLIKEVRNSWGDMADDFTSHRSRWAAIGAKRLMYNEHLVRLNRADLRPPDVLWPKDVVIKAQNMWLDVMREFYSNMRIGSHTEHYITEHADSSAAPGVKWKGLLPHQLKDILYAAKAHIGERIEEGIGTNKVISPLSLHYGSRARSPSMPSNPNGWMELTRTRIVMYKGAMSGANAFVPKKSKLSWYARALDKVSDGLGFKVLSPVTMGGQYYVELAEYMDKYHYVPTDGANWEINVPKLIPNILAYTVLGEKVLPSGSFDTSLLGSLASIVRAAKWIKDGVSGIEAISVMGDDLGVFVRNKNVKLPDIPEISETDLADMKYKYCLGWSYLNPSKPHPCGIKGTGDDPKGTQNSRVGSTVPLTARRKLSYQEIRTLVGLYKGMFDDGRTFLDLIRALPTSEENYPRQIRSWIIENGSVHKSRKRRRKRDSSLPLGDGCETSLRSLQGSRLAVAST